MGAMAKPIGDDGGAAGRTVEPGRTAATPPRSDAPLDGLLSSVLDSLGEVVFLTDAEGNWTYLNDAWRKLTGFSVDETLGTNFLDYVHPDEREHTIALFMAVVAGGAELCHHQTRYLTKDGGSRWVDLRARVIRDADGTIRANHGTLTDITARRRAEDSVEEHSQVVELVGSGAELDDLPVGTVVYAQDLTVERASPLVERLLGDAVAVGTPVDALRTRLEPVATGSDLHGPWGLVATARRTHRPQHGTLYVTDFPRGLRLAFHVSVLPLTDSATAERPGRSAGPVRLALVFHDVTHLRRAEQQQAAVARLGQRGLAGAPVEDLLEETVHVVAEALNASHCTILEALPDGEGFLARAVVGWPDGTRGIGFVPGHPPLSVLVEPLTSGAPVVAADLHEDEHFPAHTWLQRAGVVSAVGVPVHGGKGTPYGLITAHAREPREFSADEVGFLQAVANVLASAIQRARAEEATRHQALHDSLTGLANRVLLHDRLEQALSARRRRGGGAALLLADLDRFKEINDTLGHDVGDAVLSVVASRLLECTRAGDTVARLGGDEFAVVLPSVTSRFDALHVAEKMRARMSELIEHQSIPLRVDASVGIAMAPEHGEDPIDLLKRADVAMYRAKHLSTGVAIYSRENDENYPERLAYFAALREAVTGDELVVHYQPKVDLTTGRVTSVEALVRWEHPRRGLVAPDLFIPLAERTGLIKPLTWRVLSMALRQAAEWQAQGVPLRVAVNLSAQLLHDPDLLVVIPRELASANLPARMLELELTESAVASSPSTALESVRRLRDLGVRLSIDDFGTGYSSLAQIRNLPVHHLKIDRSFVRDVTANDMDASIVRSVIDLGHNLGLSVIAEGIETREAYQLLQELGCDEGQGYFLGRPAPTLDLTDLGRAAGTSA